MRIAQAEAERPLHVHHRVIVVVAAHLPHVLARLVVVCSQRVNPFGVSEGQPAAEVHLARQQVGQRVAAVVAGKHDVYDCLCQRFDVAYDARPPLVEHEHNRFSLLGESLYKVALVLGERQVVEVARRFAVRVLAYAGYDDVSRGRSLHSLVYLRGVFFPPVVVLVRRVSDARLIAYVGFSELVAQRFVDCVVRTGELVGAVSLPGVRPSAVKAAHGVGVRAGQ